MPDELDELRARLYFDQDVRMRLAGMLRAHGIDVLTTLEAARLGRPDEDQLAFAASEGRVLVTHNREDFERLHLEYAAAGREHAGIIVATVRRDLTIMRDRILSHLNNLDRTQIANLYLYA